MIKKKYFFYFILVLMMISCSARKKNLKVESSESYVSEDILIDKDIMIKESISEDYFGNREYGYPGKLSDNEFPNLVNYGEFVNILIKNIDYINLDNLYFCNTKKMTLYDDNLKKISLSKDCPQIKEIHVQSCTLDNEALFFNFSNLEYIFFFNTKIEIVPDLSKNMKLKKIMFDNEIEYNDNLDIVNTIRKLYPDVKIRYFTGHDDL